MQAGPVKDSIPVACPATCVPALLRPSHPVKKLQLLQVTFLPPPGGRRLHDDGGSAALPGRQLLQSPGSGSGSSRASACTPATVDTIPGDVNGDCLFNMLVRTAY